MRIGPVGFLFVVAAGWAGVRGVMLWPERRAPETARSIAWQAPLEMPRAALETEQSRAIASSTPLPATTSGPSDRKPTPRLVQQPVSLALMEAPQPRAQAAIPRPSVAPIQPLQPPSLPKAGRLSVSAWAIVRGDAAPGLASAGQLGGSQAGMRARYSLGSGLAAAVRVSGPLWSSRGKEAAVALDWRPIRRVPLTFTIERRAGLDRGGRDAFAAGAFGGFDAPLPRGLRADGYAQAGVVGVPIATLRFR